MFVLHDYTKALQEQAYFELFHRKSARCKRGQAPFAALNSLLLTPLQYDPID